MHNLETIVTDIPGFMVRFAKEADCALILEFIQALAVYEKMEDQVVATIEKLRDSLFVRRQAEVLIGESGGRPVACAIFFHNYSTFQGRANLYLEDLFVKEEDRGNGFGRAMLRALATVAVERGCGRLDWSCLDWNAPSIEFYKKLGAVPMKEWIVFRLKDDALEQNAYPESVAR